MNDYKLDSRKVMTMYLKQFVRRPQQKYWRLLPLGKDFNYLFWVAWWAGLFDLLCRCRINAQITVKVELRESRTLLLGSVAICEAVSYE